MDVVSSSSLFLSDLNRCPRRKDPKPCVNSAVARALGDVVAMRKLLAGLQPTVGGGCAAGLRSVKDRLRGVTGELSSLAASVQGGQDTALIRLSPEVQNQLRSLAASSRQAQQGCAPDGDGDSPS